MSAHPMHGAKPQARALTARAVFGTSAARAFWKTVPHREGCGDSGRNVFLGSRSEAEARATRMGIPFAEVSRV